MHELVLAWATVAAIIIAPYLAVQITRYLDDRKEKRAQRLLVFKTLMATRGTKLALDHVRALNMIDVEFDKDKEVLAAWRDYRAQLYVATLEEWQRNTSMREDLFGDLLQKMGRKLGYDFDIKNIKIPSYSPQMYEEAEFDMMQIRRNLREVLENKRAIPICEVNHLAPNKASKPTLSGE